MEVAKTLLGGGRWLPTLGRSLQVDPMHSGPDAHRLHRDADPGRSRGRFSFSNEGPLFTDLLLGDEINRAPRKKLVRLSLLERCGALRTVDRRGPHPLGEWFTVLATQNPIEQEERIRCPRPELRSIPIQDSRGATRAPEEEVRVLASSSCEPRATRRYACMLDAPELRPAALTSSKTIDARGDPQYAVALCGQTRGASRISVGGLTARGAMDGARAKAIAALEGRRLRSDVRSIGCVRIFVLYSSYSAFQLVAWIWKTGAEV